MDKNSSFRCVKFSLVAGNAVVILLGVTGFILGLIDPPFLQMYDLNSDNLYPVDYGPSLALVSCIAVVIATAGLIGAIREHFYLLIVYCLCIIGVFIFRVAWWATSQLHQDKRFILDLTISLTLLTFLAKLFLLIFAILEALTIQNSLPLTKQKFLMLRSKLIKGNDSGKNVNFKEEKPKKAGKPLPPDNIYITSSSIYGSGRRRSPVRMNGHGQPQQHVASQRSRKYLPGVGFSAGSPNSSGSSHDSNNNRNMTGTTATLQNASIQTKSDTPLTIDTLDQQQQQHRVPKSLSHEHYFRYQSPSPSTPTSAKEIFASKPGSQSVFSYYQPSHRSTTPQPPLSATELKPTATKANSLPPASRVAPTPAARFSPLYTSSTTLLTTTTKALTSSAQSQPTYTTSSNYPRPSTLTSSHYPKPVTPTSRVPLSSTSVFSTTTKVIPTTANSYTREQMQNQRANFFTSPPTTYSSSNLFNYSPLRSSSPLPAASSSRATTATTTATSSSMNQTQNLFSPYISPLNSLSSKTTTAAASSSSVTTPSNYRSTLLGKSITSPSPLPRFSKTPMTVASSSSASQGTTNTTTATPNYLQLSLSRTNTTTPGSTSVYRSLFSPSPKPTALNASSTTASTITSNASLSRHQPTKSYEDQYLNYVKSYRYPSGSGGPTEYTTIKSATATSSPSLVSPISMRLTQPISDRTAESYNMTRSGSMGANLETTTTYLTTTTEHREMRQKESVYYREVVREG